MKYLLFSTLSLALAGCATSERSTSASSETPASRLAPLPETVTSFGAVTTDGWLYVFGGHKGERHEYSVDMVSGSFHRLRLSEGLSWEKLPAAFPGQGQPLVANNGQVYRAGGMAARNPAGTKQDLYSLALAQRFDPKRGGWQDIAPLPAPRSSHDAVVLGNTLYIAGGWQLSGGTNKPVWPANALSLDLSDPRASWKEFAQPFQRRGLALASIGTRVYCIGGMDSDNQPTLAVEVFDTVTRQWTKGPDLPPGRHKGFSCSAITQDRRLYVTTFKGDLLRLSANGREWEVVGKLEHPRLAHRLVTAGETHLVALGGEDGEQKRPDLELLRPNSTPLVTASAEPAGGQAANATSN